MNHPVVASIVSLVLIVLVINSGYINDINTTPDGYAIQTPHIPTATPTPYPTFPPTTVVTTTPTTVPTVVTTVATTATPVTSTIIKQQSLPTSIVKSYPYKYIDLEGNITFNMVDDIEYFSSKKHVYYPYFQEENVVIYTLFEDRKQNVYLTPLVHEIKRHAVEPYDDAKIAISLVQHIQYNSDYGNLSDYWYPYETLYHEEGICSDKSILLIYLLSSMNYDVAYLRFIEEKHAAVGIRCDPGHDFRNSGYAFIETTFPTIPTFMSGGYGEDKVKLTSCPEILKVGDGKLSLPLEEEYTDQIEYTLLTEEAELNGGYLYDEDYDRWVDLREKYGA